MTDLFSSDQDPGPLTFDSLVGDGKKFKTPDELAKAKMESDNFIEQLKAEAAELRTELRSRTNLEELVNQMKRPQEPTRETPPTRLQEPTQETKTPEHVDLKTEVARLLAEERNKSDRETNLNTARQGLKERFGADYNQTLKTIASELSVTEQFLTEMAATTPTGFLKLVDSAKAPDDKRPMTPPAGRDTGPTPSATGRKNKAYYDAIRKSDINLYLSPKIQNELHREAMTQGDRFFE